MRKKDFFVKLSRKNILYSFEIRKALQNDIANCRNFVISLIIYNKKKKNRKERVEYSKMCEMAFCEVF